MFITVSGTPIEVFSFSINAGDGGMQNHMQISGRSECAEFVRSLILAGATQVQVSQNFSGLDNHIANNVKEVVS